MPIPFPSYCWWTPQFHYFHYLDHLAKKTLNFFEPGFMWYFSSCFSYFSRDFYNRSSIITTFSKSLATFGHRTEPTDVRLTGGSQVRFGYLSCVLSADPIIHSAWGLFRECVQCILTGLWSMWHFECLSTNRIKWFLCVPWGIWGLLDWYL